MATPSDDRAAPPAAAVSPVLVPQAEWSLAHEEGVLVLTGGADALFAFVDLEPEAALGLLSAWRSGPIDPAALDPAARDVLFQLRDIGAVRGVPRERADLRMGLRFVGAALDALEHELVRQGLAPAAEGDDLLLLVRTNAELKQACDDGYGSLATPHLLLDLGFRDTISLGPLVFPGETACLGCLVGRIAHYWGDARPPERPAALRHAALAAALVGLELERFAAGDYRLVNETVSFRLDRLETRRSSVYRLPWCPVCRAPEEPVGSIPLPWAGGT